MSEPIKGVEIVAREMLEETYPKACEILKNWQAALLEAAADRAEQAMRKPYRDADEDVSHVRDAILGRPRFAEGQIVRWREGDRHLCEWTHTKESCRYEPVRIKPLPGGYGKVVSDGRRVEVRE